MLPANNFCVTVSKADLSGHCWSNAQEAGERTSKMALLEENAVKHSQIYAGCSKCLKTHDWSALEIQFLLGENNRLNSLRENPVTM